MTLIHILDKQTDEIISTLDNKKGEYYLANRVSTIDNNNILDFTALRKLDKLEKRNRLLLKNKDGFFDEYIIFYTENIKRNEKLVRANGSFIDLDKAKIIPAGVWEGQTSKTITETILNGTEWMVGDIEFVGARTITTTETMNPYSFLMLIASTFDLEIKFRIEVKDNKISRYVDMAVNRSKFSGKEIEFGKDLIGLKRMEDSNNIVTALVGYGPEREDGTRLEVLVENKEALERWGREGKHLILPYYPESNDQNMSLETLTSLTENELKKRIEALVKYECIAAAIEHIEGHSHEKIRTGMTIRIKDDGYSPPLYLEARFQEVEDDPASERVLSCKIGEFIEYRKEDLEKQVKALKDLMSEKLSKLILASITSSAGNVFKNGTGSTVLTARTFLGGTEVDTEGIRYTYNWTKRDKDGTTVIFSETSKAIIVTSADIVEKATYICEVLINSKVSQIAQITITHVSDGTPGDDGLTPHFHTAWATNSTGTAGFSTTESLGKTYIGTYTDYVEADSIDPAKYKWALIKGADGVTTYTWRKYADDDLGNGMSDSPSDKRYLGLAFNKTTQTESTLASDYTWSPLYDNVEVGAINLFPDSFLRRVSNNNSNNGTFSRIAGVPTNTVRMESNGAGSYFGFTTASADRKINFQNGETYALSFLARGNVVDFNYVFMMRSNLEGTNSGFAAFPVTLSETEWTKVVMFKDSPWTTETGYLLIGSKTIGIDKWFEIKEVKLEQGNIATDWSPNPDETLQVEKLYNGVSISEADGFKVVRSDGLVQVLQNATKGILVQKRATTLSAWTDVFFVDTDGNVTMAGKLKAVNGTEYLQIDGTSVTAFYGSTAGAGRTLFRLDDTFPSMYDGNRVSSKVEGYGKMYSQRIQFWVPARTYNVGDYLEMAVPIKNHEIMGLQVVSIIKCQSVIKEMYAYEKLDTRVFDAGDLQSFVLRLSPYYNHTVPTGFYADVDIMIVGWR